jgi:ribosome biogenesis GTPase A
MENKVDELENVIKESSTKDDFLTKSGEQFYDVVIDIDSINALKYKGWEINYNEERKEIYEKIINEETIKIGVLGLNNVGKSFILGLIANVIIPTGHSIATKGISIKYTEGENESEKGVCLLDSAGFETPLLKDELLIKEKKEDSSKKR